ncbi:MAG: hypothetical protein CMF48_05010 [Legionellales bacterium]|nr:hypothetical protein [Legionellales bacterium]|tara:strand:+ start:1685 stop:2260 length:576 start_codon:yes stop_codon:yes gene_type:complete
MSTDTPDWYDEKADYIEVVAYNPDWPNQAQQMIENLKEVFELDSNIVAYEHIGSTAIPGLSAKPIIDIYIGVKSVERAKKLMVKPIENMDFLYWAENPNPEKMMFIKGMPPFGKGRTHHIHVVEYDSKYWKARLAFRDYLRAHTDARMEYEAEKLKLAETFKYDREGYSEGKNKIVTDLLTRARFEGYKGR